MASPQPTFSGVRQYVWWFPGSPVRVHLALELVERLRQHLETAGPKYSGEGLLFGKPVEGGTELTAFEAADGRIADAAARAGQAESGPRLVGYYRFTGDALQLSDADVALQRCLFTEPYHVFLLIQPAAVGPPNASFFFPDSAGRMAQFSLMEFPFERNLLAGEELERLTRVEAAAARRAAVHSSDAPPLPAPAPLPIKVPALLLEPAPRGHWVPIALVAFLIASGAGIWKYRDWLPQTWLSPRATGAGTRERSPAMGLRARRENRDVEISWNRESAVLAEDSSGLLTLQDGSLQREIPLDAGQLRSSNSVVYTPTGSNLNIRLSVHTPRGDIVESVMLVGVESTPPPAPSGASGALLPRAFFHSEPPPLPLEDGRNTADQSGPYSMAQPSRKTLPRLSPELLRTLERPVTFTVRVLINKDGTVARAEAAHLPRVSTAVLDEMANAARSWTFTPARRGDDPVESEYTLSFHYGN